MERLTELIQWSMLLIKFFILIIAILLIFKVWKFFFGFSHHEFVNTALTSSTESDLIVTGFAQVDLLYLKNGGSELIVPSKITEGENVSSLQEKIVLELPKAKEYCLHTYELAFGYRSLAAEKGYYPGAGESPVREPEIISINTLRTENAPDNSTVWCQKKNLKPRRDDLRAELKFAMEYDEIWESHIYHGQKVLARALDLANKKCREINDIVDTKNETECKELELITYLGEKQKELVDDKNSIEAALSNIKMQKNSLAVTSPLKLTALNKRALEQTNKLIVVDKKVRAHESALASVDANVASIVLTFSNIFGVSQERRNWIFFKSKKFLLQRDIAKVYYGAPISPSSIRTKSNLFGPRSISILLQKPNIIAVDRYTSFVVSRNKIDNTNDNNSSLAGYINQQILNSLSSGIARYHNSAVSASEKIMLDRISEYYNLEGVDYDVEFRQSKSGKPSLNFVKGLIDLTSSEIPN